jgi:hypothetical protein
VTRVLLFSKRNLEARKWHAFQYEFEDVIAELDAAQLLAPPLAPASRREQLVQRIQRRAGHPERYFDLPIEPVTVEGRFDLFFAVFHFAPDISYLQQLRQARDRCEKAICFIPEVYEPEKLRPYLQLLRECSFDHVFLFNGEAAEGVSKIAGCPATFMPVGVDMVRFSPYPDPPARTVDLYQFGRRSPVTHAAALEMARNGAYYVYDTVFDVPLPDYRAHRELIASTMKRSKYFFAYRAGQDVARAAATDDLSARYFEGMAGGAVLLGSAPDTDEYRTCFPWPDSTIEIPYEAHDLAELVADLDAQPERLARARARNVAGMLRRHDWSHRWATILEVAGMDQPPALQRRLERLEELATLAEAGVAPAPQSSR